VAKVELAVAAIVPIFFCPDAVFVVPTGLLRFSSQSRIHFRQNDRIFFDSS